MLNENKINLLLKLKKRSWRVERMESKINLFLNNQCCDQRQQQNNSEKLMIDSVAGINRVGDSRSGYIS
jgi:hypothetical protein